MSLLQVRGLAAFFRSWLPVSCPPARRFSFLAHQQVIYVSTKSIFRPGLMVVSVLSLEFLEIIGAGSRSLTTHAGRRSIQLRWSVRSHRKNFRRHGTICECVSQRWPG